MSTWTVAGVQMDCRLDDKPANLAAVLAHLRTAAAAGARLIVFPECCLTGYAATGRPHAESLAEPVPGPHTEPILAACRELNVFAAVGLLERAGDKVYNACALLGPAGVVTCFRKIHIPCVGADRFTDPGPGPLAVHDLGGLKVGLCVCFDGSFPETGRVMTLLGADLILQPTNWAAQALKNATLVARVRAFENHVYWMPVNRVGDEAGFHYIGHSSVIDYLGDFVAQAAHDREEIVYATIDPDAARNKHVVHCTGEYEIDRVNWRRPDVYGPLVTTPATPYSGWQSQGERPA